MKVLCVKWSGLKFTVGRIYNVTKENRVINNDGQPTLFTIGPHPYFFRYLPEIKDESTLY